MQENEEIITKYNKYKKTDPYPEIPPALLNSADIHSYVNAVGMIHPFYEDKLKSASYEASIKGLCRSWKEPGKPYEEELLQSGDKFTLGPNEIAFVEIEPTFRLPNYIALRFNLKITHVYRGLLLGTGPLIDPGYEGNIFIPLHNLTENNYELSCGEGLIWIEFTKTSPIPIKGYMEEQELLKVSSERVKKYNSFRDDKKNKHLDYFIGKALKGNEHDYIISSIPAAMIKAKTEAESASIEASIAKKAAEDAKAEAEKAKKTASNYATWGGLGIVFLITALIYSVAELLYQSFDSQKYYIETAEKNINIINNQFSKTRSKFIESDIKLQKQIDDFIDMQKLENLELKKKIDKLEKNNAKQAGLELKSLPDIKDSGNDKPN